MLKAAWVILYHRFSPTPKPPAREVQSLLQRPGQALSEADATDIALALHGIFILDDR
jgi:hypothetical protein